MNRLRKYLLTSTCLRKCLRSDRLNLHYFLYPFRWIGQSSELPSRNRIDSVDTKKHIAHKYVWHKWLTISLSDAINNGPSLFRAKHIRGSSPKHGCSICFIVYSNRIYEYRNSRVFLMRRPVMDASHERMNRICVMLLHVNDFWYSRVNFWGTNSV